MSTSVDGAEDQEANRLTFTGAPLRVSTRSRRRAASASVSGSDGSALPHLRQKPERGVTLRRSAFLWRVCHANQPHVAIRSSSPTAAAAILQGARRRGAGSSPASRSRFSCRPDSRRVAGSPALAAELVIQPVIGRRLYPSSRQGRRNTANRANQQTDPGLHVAFLSGTP